MMRVRRSREKHTHIYKNKQKTKKPTHVVTGGTIGCLDNNPRSRLRRQKSSNRRPPAPLRVCFLTAARGDISIDIHTHIYINLPVSSDNSSVFTSNTSGCVRNPDYVCRILNGSTGRLKVGVCQAPSHRPLLLCIYPTTCGACRGRLTPTLAH